MNTAATVEVIDFSDEMARFNGTYISKEVELGTPVVKQMFMRNYMAMSRNLFFIAFFAQYQMNKDEKRLKELNTTIDTLLTKRNQTLDKMQERLRAVIADAKITDMARHSKVLRGGVPVMTQKANQVLSIFLKADEVLRSASTCWLHGEVDDAARDKIVNEVKTVIRGLHNVLRTQQSHVLKQAKEEKLANDQAGHETPEEVVSQLQAAEEFAAVDVVQADDEDAEEFKNVAVAPYSVAVTAEAQAEPALADA